MNGPMYVEWNSNWNWIRLGMELKWNSEVIVQIIGMKIIGPELEQKWNEKWN